MVVCGGALLVIGERGVVRVIGSVGVVVMCDGCWGERWVSQQECALL